MNGVVKVRGDEELSSPNGPSISSVVIPHWNNCALDDTVWIGNDQMYKSKKLQK